MANTLIGCGGTGAHVALAFMRLRALGDLLGFFRKIELPSFYLVDQDYGDNEDKPTAWQALENVVEGHPSRVMWGDAAGQQRCPGRTEISPLPVGRDGGFLRDGMENLEERFPNSDYLSCLLSAEQRQIDFSRGMMGSPAVGSLLFEMKRYDTRPDDGANFDKAYNQLLRATGNVAVVGSGVGGTGAAVAPTLAQQLADGKNRSVMAVMLLNWFQFDEQAQHLGENLGRAQRRNRMLLENANSGLAYYGEQLTRHVATVPVGVPESALEIRDFTGDSAQPKHEAFPHAVAALSCMNHFLGGRHDKGLYHMDAEDPTVFGAGTGLLGDGGGTVGDLEKQAAVFLAATRIFRDLLKKERKSWLVTPAVLEAVRPIRPATSAALGKICDAYDENLTWLRGMMGRVGADAAKPGRYTLETEIRERLAEEQLDGALLREPETAAYELCRWTAEWIGQEHRSQPGPADGVYWPPMTSDVGLAPKHRTAGKVTSVPDGNIGPTLKSFIENGYLTQNGWPNPVAATDYFAAAVARADPEAIRQLELLLVATVAGEVDLLATVERDGRAVSLDRIVKDQREDDPDLASYRLRRRGHDGVVLGFTSSRTLLCPAPGVSERIWSEVWRSVTGRPAGEWLDPGASWGRATLLVNRIREWIRACERRYPNANPPAWTRVLRSHPESSTSCGFGVGNRLKVKWGNEFEEVFLPTAQPGDLGLEVLRSFAKADGQAFLDRHGIVRDADGTRLFWRTSFAVPGLGEVHGIWRDHLEHLQALGDIEFFGSDPGTRQVFVVVWSDENHRYECVVLPGTELLDRATIATRECTPMTQVGVPGGEVASRVLYPDYPLRAAFVDLVKLDSGAALVDHLKEGGSFPAPRPDIRPSESGEQATWSIPVRGRRDAIHVTLALPAEERFHKAHWMVWPRFRSPGWRAYYVYQHCTDPLVRVDAVWLREGPEGAELQLHPAPDERSYPLAYDGERGRHDGGAPVALSPRRGDRELGLYVVGLESVDDAAVPLSVGVDFGTSHTAAAIQVGGHPPRHIDLDPELVESPGMRLSHHVSQNMDHVEASLEDVGLLSSGTWFPSYVKGTAEGLRGLWPSELLAIPEVKRLDGAVRRWQPVRDYVIPPVGVQRRDLATHMIANFKWAMSDEFHGKEAKLREIYMDRILEQVLAEALQRYGRPSDAMQCTFTYPLRTPKGDVEEYQESLKRVIERASAASGCPLELHGGEGLYDESHAARVGAGLLGDVNLIGDLGGGTLDLLITAEDQKGKFQDAADSVKVGGNVLLRLLAEQEGVLPHGWGEDAAARATHLTAWIRTVGMSGLFGTGGDRVKDCHGLGLRGFGDARGPKAGQRIIRRYFFLIAEYMARSLTAYLAKHWYPRASDEERQALRLRVYLRGNGWKLWPGDAEYRQIGSEITGRIKARVDRLWAELDDPGAGAPPDASWVDDHHGAGDPKREVVRQVVNESKSHEKVWQEWFAHTLVDLALVDTEQRRSTVPWFARVPFPTAGEDTVIEFGAVSPRIPLSSPEQTPREWVSKLPVPAVLEINEGLKDRGEFMPPDQLEYQAPIAAWVWEATLKNLAEAPDAAGGE